MGPPDPTLRTRIRGQSEVIGTLLLVSIVFITAGIVGVTLTANMVSQSTSDRIVIDCDIASADGDVTLTHDGGVAADIGYLTVLLRNDSRTTRRPLVVDTGDGDDRFEIGEQASLGTIGGMTEVLLLGSEEIICEETLVSRGTSTATPTPTQTPTATPTQTATPTPIPDAPPLPSIDGVTDTSQCKEGNPNDNDPCSTRNEVEFAVAWSASDDNGLSSVTIDLSTSNGVVVASESVTVSGTSASGSVTLSDTGGYNQIYTITVTATDSSQQSAAVTAEHTADGDGIGSPP